MPKVDLGQQLSDTRARLGESDPSFAGDGPMYATLVRKDVRLRADQTVALTALMRGLMRRRTTRTERITENTLIRVAIDALLHSMDTLQGSTEDELRRCALTARSSRTPQLPRSGTPEAPDSGVTEVLDSGAAAFRTPIPHERTVPAGVTMSEPGKGARDD
ncbi:hypothetical protein ABC304_07600 [Microbacterium sp. 1P10UB]